VEASEHEETMAKTGEERETEFGVTKEREQGRDLAV
jgi:hypothetical protein